MTEVDRETWDEIQRELREGTPDTPERIATFKRADEIFVRMEAKRLAQALCDSSSHINLLPRAEQRPCEYHIKRATDTLALLGRRPLAMGKAQ